MKLTIIRKYHLEVDDDEIVALLQTVRIAKNACMNDEHRYTDYQKKIVEECHNKIEEVYDDYRDKVND